MADRALFAVGLGAIVGGFVLSVTVGVLSGHWYAPACAGVSLVLYGLGTCLQALRRAPAYARAR